MAPRGKSEMSTIFSKYFRSGLIRRLRVRVIPNIGSLLTKSTVRRCGSCDRFSVILHFGSITACARCGANRRYETLGTYLRSNHPPQGKDILELDPNSALRRLLRGGKAHIRSYYNSAQHPGSRRTDGAVMEDITRLTLADESIDLIVSSDVLEHVSDVTLAFRESFRVLRPGGAHVFTVPSQPATVRRAVVENGHIRHLVTPPEYHLDPLNPEGILAFWHFGKDLQQWFGDSGLIFTLTKVAVAKRGEVWEARKPDRGSQT